MERRGNKRAFHNHMRRAERGKNAGNAVTEGRIKLNYNLPVSPRVGVAEEGRQAGRGALRQHKLAKKTEKDIERQQLLPLAKASIQLSQKTLQTLNFI